MQKLNTLVKEKRKASLQDKRDHDSLCFYGIFTGQARMPGFGWL